MARAAKNTTSAAPQAAESDDKASAAGLAAVEAEIVPEASVRLLTALAAAGAEAHLAGSYPEESVLVMLHQRLTEAAAGIPATLDAQFLGDAERAELRRLAELLK